MWIFLYTPYKNGACFRKNSVNLSSLYNPCHYSVSILIFSSDAYKYIYMYMYIHIYMYTRNTHQPYCTWWREADRLLQKSNCRGELHSAPWRMTRFLAGAQFGAHSGGEQVGPNIWTQSNIELLYLCREQVAAVCGRERTREWEKERAVERVKEWKRECVNVQYTIHYVMHVCICYVCMHADNKNEEKNIGQYTISTSIA